MVAKKKADTIMKEKEIKKKPEPQKINLDHDFSFNLLTEPWLPVVSMKGEKKFPSLNEFLKQAQDLERFDFPLPGLETAVLRFLVAIVHIVGAPNDKAEWEDWYKRGKFEDTFITELQKYKDKLDLFSKTDPFLQEIELKSSLVSELNNINRLIHFFPYDTNPTHWMHKFDALEDRPNALAPEGVIWLLLLYNCTAYSGGSGYKPGINGKPPNYVLLTGNSLYHSILLNTPHNEVLNEFANSKKTIDKTKNGFISKLKGETLASEINLQTGLLWKSRQLLFVPEPNTNKQHCNISNSQPKIIIQNFILKPQGVFLKKGQYWSDPNVIRIDLGSKGQKNLNESGILPIWREYPSMLLTSGLKDERRKANLFSPLVIQQCLTVKKITSKYKIHFFSFSTVNNAKINQMYEQKYSFSPEFIDNEEIIKSIRFLIQFVDTFSYQLKTAFKISFDIKKGSNQQIPDFQSAYWHELGAMFEDSLARLADSDKYADEVLQDWKKMLAKHVRLTFERHTHKLIHNPKNLKAYENGRRYIEIGIYSQLTKEQT